MQASENLKVAFGVRLMKNKRHGPENSKVRVDCNGDDGDYGDGLTILLMMVVTMMMMMMMAVLAMMMMMALLTMMMMMALLAMMMIMISMMMMLRTMIIISMSIYYCHFIL